MANSVKRKSFIFASALMFIAGIIAILMAFVLLITKLRDGDATRILVYITLILGLAYGVFEIVSGIASLSERRKITNQSGSVSLAKLCVIFCIIQMILSAFNGIIVWHLAIVFVAGIVVPIIYLIASKKGRIKKPIRRMANEGR